MVWYTSLLLRMLLLKFRILVIVQILFSLNLLGQIELLDDFYISQIAGDLIPSLNEGGVVTVLHSRQQEQDTSYTSIIELDTKLEVTNEFVLPFNEFPFAAVFSFDIYDDEHYMLLVATDNSSSPEDRLNRKLSLMILSKDFTTYTLVEAYDWGPGYQLYNSSMVHISDSTVRYYFSLANLDLGLSYELNFFDFDLTLNEVFNKSISEINPEFIYRDTEIVDSLLYFSSFGGFHHKSLDGEEYQNYLIGWPKSAPFSHYFRDLHFEILSNRKIVMSGHYDYQFNDIGDNHGIVVFHLDSLVTQSLQDTPEQIYTTDLEKRSRAFSKSTTKIPDTDEVWVYSANVSLLDVSFPLPDRNTTLYFSKLNSEGELDFTVDVAMDGYAFPSHCTSDAEGNVYASGFITKASEDEYWKGFIVKVNRNGELTEIIETPLDLNSIAVYPNPVVDNLTIDGISTGKYKLITMQGRVVINDTFSNGLIRMTGLPSGPYVLILELDGQISIQKVIKQ